MEKIIRPCPPPCTGVQTPIIYAHANIQVGWYCPICMTAFPNDIEPEPHIWQNQVRAMERGHEDL